MAYVDLKNGRFYLGDCLEVMKEIPDNCIDMVLCDLPYGTTQNKWDSIIPFAPLWAEYNRLCKGPIVLTSAQPFTSALVMSNVTAFKYDWIYRKSNATGHLNANRMPMRRHESILIFGSGIYNPQKFVKDAKNVRHNKAPRTNNGCYGAYDPLAVRTDNDDVGFPQSVLDINNSATSKDKGLHPTQKPVALCEYLIKTYTNEGMLVLDNCAGSGTTAIACMNTKRRWVCIEKDESIATTAYNRILEHEV